jgi:4-diphosphocytidyl-2-C-methyl-D-erythritol kinase
MKAQRKNEKNAQSTTVISTTANAKINLFLDVLGKRPDGYHSIRTVFAEIDLYDELNYTLTKNTGIKILTNRDFVNTEDNLIYKVAFFIQKTYNVRYGVTVHLQKHIPIAAGLGGGSSDAAATIRALSQLWMLDLSAQEQHAIAAQFGSDINFFLEGGTALGLGRGEEISPLSDIPLDNIFLVNPGFGISSGEAYRLVTPMHSDDGWKKLIEEHDIRHAHNTLQSGICDRYPRIRDIINHLCDTGAVKAILSGSGPTIIGFCPDRNTAQRLSEFYSTQGYWNYITKTKRRTR